MKTLFTFFLFFLSLQMSAQVSAYAGPDKEVCIQDTLKLAGSGLNAGDSGSYQWKDLNSNMVVSLKEIYEAKLTSMTGRKYELMVTLIKMGVPSYAYDTVEVTVNALPTFSFKGIPPMCYYDGAVNLTERLIAIAHSGDNTIHDSDIRYFQPYKNPNWITGGPAGSNPYYYNFPKFVTNAQVPKTGLSDTVCYDYTDYKGCYNKECRPVKLNPNPVVETRDGIFCQKAGNVILDNLVMKPIAKIGGIQSFKCLSVPAGSGVDPNTIISVDNSSFPPKNLLDPGASQERHKAGTYVVAYSFKDGITGCASSDTSNIQIIRLPLPLFSAPVKLCINGGLAVLDSFARDSFTGKRMPFATWETVAFGGSRDMSNPGVRNKILNSVKSLKLFDPSLGAGQYLIKFRDSSSGCPVQDSINVVVNGLPIVQINVPDTVCYNDAPFILQNISPLGPVGHWSGPGVLGRKFYPGESTQNSQYESFNVQYEYTNPLTLCHNSETATIKVKSMPRFKAKARPYKGSPFLVDFSLENVQYFNGCIWYLGNGDSSTQTDPQGIPFADSGTFTAYVYSSGMCQVVDSVTFTLDYRVNIQDPQYWQTKVSVFPNPARDVLHIDMPFDAAINLWSSDGKSVLQYAYTAGSAASLTLPDVQAGIYMISIQTGEGVMWKRMIIQ